MTMMFDRFESPLGPFEPSVSILTKLSIRAARLRRWDPEMETLLIEQLISGNWQAQRWAASHRWATENVLLVAIQHKDPSLNLCAIENPNVSPAILKEALQRPSLAVWCRAINHPQMPLDDIETAMHNCNDPIAREEARQVLLGRLRRKIDILEQD
jgi:hypothetical protein